MNGIALILRGSFLIKAIHFVNGTDIQNAIFESGLLIQLFVCIISMTFPYFLMGTRIYQTSKNLNGSQIIWNFIESDIFFAISCWLVPQYFIQNILAFPFAHYYVYIDCQSLQNDSAINKKLLIRIQEVDSINLKISQNANRFVRIAGSKRILTVFIIYIKYLEKYNFEILFSFATLENSALVLPWNGG